MAQGFKFSSSAANKKGTSHTKRKQHTVVKKKRSKVARMSNGTVLATKKINKGLETLLAQAASGPSSGTAMSIAKPEKNVTVTSIKGGKLKSLRVAARANKY